MRYCAAGPNLSEAAPQTRDGRPETKAPTVYEVGLALRAGLDCRNKREPSDANPSTLKAPSEKRPHLEDFFGHPIEPMRTRVPSHSAVAAPAVPASTPTIAVPLAELGRNAALDFTKGALVLCMILYHTLNYFRYDPNLLRHIHFLPPSFIFIVGFLVTHLYLAKFRAGDTRVPHRLFVRGLKTLALFVALNLVVHSLFRASYNRSLGLDAFLSQIGAVFFSGEERVSVFRILLPIAYVLLISALLLQLSRWFRPALHLAAGGTFLVCVVLAHRGQLGSLPDLVSMGLVGTVAGYMSRARLDRIARPLVLLALAYAAYTVGVRYQYPTYLMNTAGIGLSLLLFYGIGLKIAHRGGLAAAVTLLGNSSLPAYLVQIAVLQVLFRVAGHVGMEEGGVIVPLLVTFVLTLAVIKAVHAARRRVVLADSAYKAVFA
jgi:peptidoglycan/LPS O-acetylase OafA/YrhL